METGYLSSGLRVVTVESGNKDEAWATIAQACFGRLTEWGTRILRRGLDGHVGTVLVEPYYICKDYRDLYSHFYSKKFHDRSSWCGRLHFFGKSGLTVGDIIHRADELGEDYIGHSVIEPIYDRCLGRTVIDPCKIGHAQSDFFCLRTTFRTHINGAEYAVRGFPYRSQSAEATRCAHTALWSMCRYLSERYSVYGDVFPYDLIRMTRDTGGRRVPYRGMTYTDYSSILLQFGSHPAFVRPRGILIANKTGQKKLQDWRVDTSSFYDLYSYVESGFPVLASYTGHVVNIIGHTSKQSPDPNDSTESAGFYNSCCLLDRYIVVDDNFFPYQQLGYKADAGNYGAGYKELQHLACIDGIVSAVVPLPEKAFLPPRDARTLCYKWLETFEAKSIIAATKTELNWADDEKMIARLFLTSCVSFKKRKRLIAVGAMAREDADKLSLYPVDLTLPHFIWVLEISPLSLYNDGLCIGEVVLDASTSKRECRPIYARVGKTVWRSVHRGLPNDDEWKNEKQAGGADALWRFRQYTHNLGEQD